MEDLEPPCRGWQSGLRRAFIEYLASLEWQGDRKYQLSAGLQKQLTHAYCRSEISLG
ncbi:hypothetical protein DPMN_115227 [Dreissena polymorpha]|uniref:Uncharacterized protein n=1 Tax=Dreissena polymorpha TaxID=45954 RepID=A0A9D4KLK3_DREPO|nr:hypothetical protein DPMN_115227 [Dreissena polymorpha]